ncbi:hypothetical protein MMC25_001286 [Agyrium rufum]|nr:hypothetical protein [Agyrium rufum]
MAESKRQNLTIMPGFRNSSLLNVNDKSATTVALTAPLTSSSDTISTASSSHTILTASTGDTIPTISATTVLRLYTTEAKALRFQAAHKAANGVQPVLTPLPEEDGLFACLNINCAQRLHGLDTMVAHAAHEIYIRTKAKQGDETNCPLCPSTQRKYQNLRNHIRKHYPGDLECPHNGCLYRGTVPGDILTHVSNVRKPTSEKVVLRCADCEYETTRLPALQLHTQRRDTA